ncbi:MAG: DUF2953 domain-containing protein [Lachnospiraceae bacterium]|nr:DUF2953 domain-containing protein [Lachnospiraceae bacterium]
MLDIILKILSIIGIVILILLIVFIVALLLVLFFPVTYRAFGKKNSDEMSAWVKANWLFGLLRIRFIYPEPGNITVKLLWFTLFDSSRPSTEKEELKEKPSIIPEETASIKNSSGEEKPSAITENEEFTGEAEEVAQKQIKMSIKEKILAKYEKIKYTILKIYDKIKHIVENIAFYKALLQDEQTVGLLRHAWFRLGRILKNIRPRKLKGTILFGTGSPDTTGYAFGAYGMLSAWLGKHINVTPDFTQAILEGEVYAAGHITIFQLLVHTLMVVLDKRLRLLFHRIKTHTI